MGQVSNSTPLELFTKHYGKLNTDILPIDDLHITKDIPFSKREQSGNEGYTETNVLGNEVGITFAGSGDDLFNINPAIAGAVKQTTIKSSISVLRSVVPWATIGRSQSSDTAFIDATKHIVKNNIISHRRFLEIVKIHGQNTEVLLGRVAYTSGNYRKAAFSNGTGVLKSSIYGELKFTNGVCINETGKYILLQAGDMASGIWVGMQSVKIKQCTKQKLEVVAEGRFISCDSQLGVLKVDFTPIAASSVGSHVLAFEGMELSNEAIGIKAILKNKGKLFGIDAQQFPIWNSNVFNLGSKALSFKALEMGVADSINAGGTFGALRVYVNPRSFHTLMADSLASTRSFDQSYKPDGIQNGAKAIKFTYSDGEMEIIGHRYMMEGDATVLRLDDWICSGSQDVSTSIEGMDGEKLFYQIDGQGGYCFHTYADMYVMCRAPAKQLLVVGINDEAQPFNAA